MPTLNTVKLQPPLSAPFELDLSLSMQRNNIFLKEISKGKSQDGVEGRQIPRQTGTNLPPQAEPEAGWGANPRKGSQWKELDWAATAKESTSVN